MWKLNRADVADISSVPATSAWFQLEERFLHSDSFSCNFDFYQGFKCRRKEQLKPSGSRDSGGRADPGSVYHLPSRVVWFPGDGRLADSGGFFHLANSSTLTHSWVTELFKLCNC